MKPLFAEKLTAIREKGNYRELCRPNFSTISVPAATPVNLSSNDYLGLAADFSLREEFLSGLSPETFILTASSSRLMTGNTLACIKLENQLCRLYGSEAALVFNSGYHANAGILPAVTDSRWLILADKQVHASLIDGIRLSKARTIRYRHCDYRQLTALLEKHAAAYKQVIIVTESIFSMDGDECDLDLLVRLKKEYPNLLLYVDEAHAVGVRGKNGLGCAEEKNQLENIDFLVGTFGKALASVGAYLICSEETKNYLVNTMRTLIFTTALPPVNLEWSRFILTRLPEFAERRIRLAVLSQQLRGMLQKYGLPVTGTGHIVPWIIGNNRKATDAAQKLQQKGFRVLPVRPPTVSEGTARLRFSLSAAHTPCEINRLSAALETLFLQRL